MTMTITILAVFAAMYFFLRPRPETVPRFGPTRRVHRIHKPFPAASVSCGHDACQAARELTEKRYLAWEAPNLPLAGCDAERCDCRYNHYSDRRAFTGDRRSGSGTEAPQAAFDRRRGIDRRRGVSRLPLTG